MSAPVKNVPTTEASILSAQRREYADYSAEQKAEVLALVALYGDDISAIYKVSQHLSIPRHTIMRWHEAKHRYVALQPAKRQELAQKLENIAYSIADSLEDHDLSIVPFSSKATSLGILIDKMQLLRNQPTVISAAEGLDPKAVIELIRDAFLAGTEAKASGTSDPPVIDVTPS